MHWLKEYTKQRFFKSTTFQKIRLNHVSQLNNLDKFNKKNSKLRGKNATDRAPNIQTLLPLLRLPPSKPNNELLYLGERKSEEK